MTVQSVIYVDDLRNDDPEAEAAREKQASRHFAKHRSLQFLAELLDELRTRKLSWFTAEKMRETFPPSVRLDMLLRRPELGAHIVKMASGTEINTSLNCAITMRVQFIEASMLSYRGRPPDCSAEKFDAALSSKDLMVHGGATKFWRLFRESLPIEDSSKPHQELMAFILKRLLAGSDGATPILTPHGLCAAIDSVVWEKRIPAEARASVTRAQLDSERADATKPFTAADRLTIVTTDMIAEYIPLSDLVPVLDAAEQAMGIEPEADPALAEPAAAVPPPAPAATPESLEPAKLPSSAPPPPLAEDPMDEIVASMLARNDHDDDPPPVLTLDGDEDTPV